MERFATKLPVPLLVAAVLALAVVLSAAAAHAEIAFTPCKSSNSLACAGLTVPLSHEGAAPGTVTLAIRRRRAPVGEPRSAVIALAGGPGQAAIPFTEAFAEILGPILSTRDLIVFDQRGTGLSGALMCRAFERARRSPSPMQIVARCGEQLGPGRGSYTTPETVADIEAIRVAGGYEKLVLYGTSYGTKVALQYAQEHPSHVEALVLDSTVASDGPDPLRLGTFAAVPGVLRRLCAFHGCAHITRDPVADLRRVVAQADRRRLRATAIDGHGRPRRARISSATLLGILVAGDLDPILRAEYPAAIRSASEHDLAPLARLLRHAMGGQEEEAERGGDPRFDLPLYFATTCEEEQFPWSRAASPKARLAEAIAKIRSLPASALAPFTRKDVLPISDIDECAGWPFTRPAPPTIAGPLPAVPTLVLSGAEDLRTPTSGVRAVAAAIPGSHLLVVPNTGHSVLTTEPGECALDALRALFASAPIRGCPRTPPPPYLKPTRLAPRRLSQVPMVHGYRGRVGRTLMAVGFTLADVSRELAVTFAQAGNLQALSHLHVGGLRGGWVAVRQGEIVLHRYSYVPGVAVSGWIRLERAELRIAGSAAARGHLRLNVKRHLVGELGRARVDIAATRLSEQAARVARVVAHRTLAPALPQAQRPAARAMIQAATLAATLQSSDGQGSLQALAYAFSHVHDAVALR